MNSLERKSISDATYDYVCKIVAIAVKNEGVPSHEYIECLCYASVAVLHYTVGYAKNHALDGINKNEIIDDILNAVYSTVKENAYNDLEKQ